MKKNISMIAVLFLLLSACDKDSENDNLTPDEPEYPVLWEAVADMHTIGVQNLYVKENELLALTQNFLFQVDLEDMTSENYFLGNYSESWATEIDADFFVKIESSWIYVFNSENPDQFAGFDIQQYLPDFGKFYFPPAWLGDVIVSNDQHVFLTVYRPQIDGVYAAEPRLLFFRVEKDSAGEVSVHDVFESSIDEGYVFGDLTGIYACGDDFLISLNPYTYKVTSDGSWELVFEGRIFDFISHGDMLLGFGDDDLLVSYDDGSSWEVMMSSFPAGFSPWHQKGYSLDDRLLVWDTNNITQIQITESGLDFVSFCIEDLDPGPGKAIHRLALSEKHVFVATQQGLYYKPLDDFWESSLRD